MILEKERLTVVADHPLCFGVMIGEMKGKARV